VNRAQFSRADIVAAAIKVTRETGATGLTMRRVAEELGAHPSALYYHVADRQALMAMVCNEVLGMIEIPGPGVGDWAARLRQLQLNLYAVLRQYAGLIPVMLADEEVPNALRLTDFSIELLRDAGLSTEQAYDATNALALYNVGQLVVVGLPGVHHSLPVGPEYLASLKGTQNPELPDTDRLFHRGLDLIIQGLRDSLHA
jgi:AcrR family transcriptional regulator